MLTQSSQPVPAFPVFQQRLSDLRVHAGTERQLRATAAIRPDTKFFVSKKEYGQGALYFYNNKTKAKRSEWTWASLFVQMMFPSVVQKPMNGKLYRDFQVVWKMVKQSWTESGISAATAVKKDLGSKTFQVTVPLLACPMEGFPPGLTRLVMALNGEKTFTGSDEYRTIMREAETRIRAPQTFDLVTVKPIGSLDTKDCEWLKTAKGKLIVKPLGGYSAAFLQLTFTQREAEFLCNSSWLEIRPLDFYGVIRSWVDNYFGMQGRSATFSIPLARIAKQSDARDARPRLSDDGLLLDHHGDLYAIPSKLNSISQYEDSASAAYSQPDGTFTAIGEDGILKPPQPSMPVYVDWANLKFAYTSLEGKLQIMGLERSQPVSTTHLVKFLTRKLSHDTIGNFLSFTIRLGNFFGLIGDLNLLRNMLFEIEQSMRRKGFYDPVENLALTDVYETAMEEESTHCKKFVEVTPAILKFIEDNPANAYAKYSVLTILEIKAGLIAFTKYAPKFTDLRLTDNKDREVYTNQGVDPKYEVPALPYVKADQGLLPHQFKVSNLLRNKPKNAILPVDAGGGKTALVLVETLKEMKEAGDALSLVMCPSHLVKDYVKEFVAFTGSAVNVIPITSYTIRRYGFDKLRDMIQKSPRNTVVVTDYNAIKLKNLTISYGITPVQMFPVVEFLRQFSFKYVACDESHKLKNGSVVNSATARLIIDIPYKRLASGTMVADTITDLVRQIALMDPSVFGTVEDFVKEFGLEVRGTKVVKWKPGAELAVNRIIKQNVVIAGAKRKEWAAILPLPIERFHVASLTDNQFRCYQNILMHIEEEIRKKALEDDKLAKLIAGEVDEEDPEMDIEMLLKPYLQRLERFLNAPGKDVLGEKILSGEDLVSPKAIKTVEICKEHIAQETPGKVLIFTNYILSAEAIYEAFPPEMRSQVILFKAGDDAAVEEFERNPDKKVMVGVEFALNTGRNLQYCSRLIRVETVWSPGTLEQGNSRIGRPNVKDGETRPYIYYDWIACNQTIDVTKISYLMAKTISTSKFYEAGNPRYEDLEVPPLMSMNLQTVFAQNDFETTLLDYFSKYEAYKQVIQAERDEYREKNKDILFDENGKIKMTRLKSSETPQGSEVMHDAAYQPGLTLEGATKLGLLRYDVYMNLDVDEDEDEDSGDDGEGEESESEDEAANADESSFAKKQFLLERAKALNLHVHMDKGDGHIVRIGKKWVKARTASGELIRASKMATFVFTKDIKGDTRTVLLQTSTELPIDKPVLKTKGKPGQVEKPSKKSPIPEAPVEVEDTSIEMQLSFTIVNDFLGVQLENLDNESAVRAAQALGFKHPPSYFAAEIKRPAQLLAFFNLLKEKGFQLDKENSAACFKAYEHFFKFRQRGTDFFGVANVNNIRNFYRLEFRPNPSITHVNPYPLIQDGVLYLALPKNGQPGSLKAIQKCRIPGLVWHMFDTEDELVCFTPRKEKAGQLIQTIIDEGITITNLKELKQQFRRLRVARDKNKEE